MNEKIKKAEGKMTKSVDRLKGEFAAIRAGRANPAVLDKAMVDYYGVPTPINHGNHQYDNSYHNSFDRKGLRISGNKQTNQ